ncbi:MAG: hypothetical protein LIO81_00170 [Clostridiales bacterium]|nr:hypothetical protein [Clostridiales bacterium]
MAFDLALSLLLLIWCVGNIIGVKTQGKMGAAFCATVILLLGFWGNIIPKTIIDDSMIVGVRTMANIGIVVNIGTSIDLESLKKEWRLALTVIGGLIGMGVLVILVGSILFGKELAVSAYPILAGGLVAANTMTDVVGNMGKDELTAILALIFSVQSLFGLPLVSIGTSMESKRLLKAFRAGEIALPGKTKGADEDKKSGRTMLIDRIPPKYMSPLLPLTLVIILGTIANHIAAYTDKPTSGILGATVIALILGVVARQAGLIMSRPIEKSGVAPLFMFSLIIFMRRTLGNIDFATFVHYLPQILCLFVLATIGMLGVGAVVGKIFGYSTGMVMAFSFGTFAGYPLNQAAAMDAVTALAETPEEEELLQAKVVNQVVLGGVVAVTICSVFIASICATLI